MSENVTEAIDNLSSAVYAGDLIIAMFTVFFLAAIFTIAAVWLTCCMHSSKSMMLGFPCAILWALAGATFYLVPRAIDPMPDMEWVTGWWNWIGFSFFFGMVVFSVLSAYALRTKKEEADEGDLYFDEGGDKDVKFIDEGGGSDNTTDDAEKPSARIKGIRDRANKRRSHYGDV